jgi:MvaI/BcnI restriction endonuclease family
MSFASLESLLRCFKNAGVHSVFAKLLAENDNSKQQIYLGNSFEVLGQLPFTAINEESGGRRHNFKAAIRLQWIDSAGNRELASGAQLILYPDYPEVRLSGFLRGCSLSPSADMQPVPPGKRRHFNGPDGRVLFFGVSDSGVVLAWLAVASSSVASEFTSQQKIGKYQQSGVFWQVPVSVGLSNRDALIAEIRKIHHAGWHEGKRLNSAGELIAYAAKNGGGYTLEALLGVKPNSLSSPDFLGYEIKAYSRSRVTLMTPEPDMGLYGEMGTEAFLRRYGRSTKNDTLYFTGSHKANVLCSTSKQILKIDGYDPRSGKISDVGGGVMLYDAQGSLSAGWSFSGLISHWGRKHACAAYIPYDNNGLVPPSYSYKNPMHIGEGTAFEFYLKALHDGKVVYDPGTKLSDATTPSSRVKARNQFRVAFKDLSGLYRTFDSVALI